MVQVGTQKNLLENDANKYSRYTGFSLPMAHVL